TITSGEFMKAAKTKQRKKKASGGWTPIYSLVKQVPRGNVTTYGEVAQQLKMSGGARTVGYAMAACPNGSGIPWHRVIGAGGHIRLREPLAALQRKLLETEGVGFIEARVDIARHSWRGSQAGSGARVKNRAKGPHSRKTR
ncbi:MAG: MGMT family protein, partial [Bryobacteraceae bacterium]